MPPLTLDELAIAFKQKPELERVDLPELGEGQFVIVRSLNGAEREAWERQFFGPDGTTSVANTFGKTPCLRAKLARLTLCNEQGEAAHKPDCPIALAQLEALPAKLLDRIYKAALRLSGLAADDVDDAEKNSEAGPSSATGSDSPAT